MSIEPKWDFLELLTVIVDLTIFTTKPELQLPLSSSLACNIKTKSATCVSTCSRAASGFNVAGQVQHPPQ